MPGRLRRTWTGRVLTSLLILAGVGNHESSLAQVPLTETQILELLKQKRLMRCPVKTLDTACGAEPKRAQIEFQIFFAYASSALDRKARSALVAFAHEIRKSEHAGDTFMIAGHADGRGSDEFNQRLSKRRAVRVKQFLDLRLDFPAEKFVVVGYGKQRLHNGAKPSSGENRRVTISSIDGK